MTPAPSALFPRQGEPSSSLIPLPDRPAEAAPTSRSRGNWRRQALSYPTTFLPSPQSRRCGKSRKRRLAIGVGQSEALEDRLVPVFHAAFNPTTATRALTQAAQNGAVTVTVTAGNQLPITEGT